MLIKCPECNHEISDQSDICVYCGYPLNKIPKINLSNKICPLCKGNRHIAKGIQDTCDICGYVFNLDECRNINPNYDPYKSDNNSLLKCPTCGSTNLKKISTASKVANTAFWGLLGTKRFKTFHCNNCGYEW